MSADYKVFKVVFEKTLHRNQQKNTTNVLGLQTIKFARKSAMECKSRSGAVSRNSIMELSQALGKRSRQRYMRYLLQKLARLYQSDYQAALLAATSNII